eukprot:995594-Pyramimonas_sp.AAC.1
MWRARQKRVQHAPRYGPGPQTPGVDTVWRTSQAATAKATVAERASVGLSQVLLAQGVPPCSGRPGPVAHEDLCMEDCACAGPPPPCVWKKHPGLASSPLRSRMEN